MNWNDFLSDNYKIRREIEREFEWMRKYAYYYYRKFVNNLETAEDFAHASLEKFIEQLEKRKEVNRAFYKRLVRYSFLDEMRRGKQRSRMIQYDDSVLNDDDSSEVFIESLANPGQFSEQEMTLKRDLLADVFKEVLGRISLMHQRIIRQKLVGFSSKEISQQVSSGEEVVSVNLINVVYHNFRKEMKDKCLVLEILPE